MNSKISSSAVNSPFGVTPVRSIGAQQSESVVDQLPVTPSPTRVFFTEFFTELANNPLQAEWAYCLLEVVRKMRETICPIDGVCLLLSEFIMNQPHNVGEHKGQLASVTLLIAHLSELNKFYDIVDENTDYANRAEQAIEDNDEYRKTLPYYR